MAQVKILSFPAVTFEAVWADFARPRRSDNVPKHTVDAYRIAAVQLREHLENQGRPTAPRLQARSRQTCGFVLDEVQVTF